VIEPIGEAEQRAVVVATRDWVGRAGRLFGRRFAMLPVLFDLKGLMVGMYRIRRGERMIRFNPYLFAKYPEDGFAVTIPHEVAHYVTDCVYGFQNIRPHGTEWREVMRAFGVDPDASVRHHLDLSGIPVRKQRRHPYRCDCRTHALSTSRHHRIMRAAAQYFCRRCGSDLTYAG
jgi:SprT protein